MGIFNALFGTNAKVDEMLREGAKVVDVRSAAEFEMGHVDGSVNIPLDQVTDKVKKIKSLGDKVVLCCASGARSGRATSFLQEQGIDCTNGGSWTAVRSALNKID